MTHLHHDFDQHRNEAFDQVISLVDHRIQTAPPALLLSLTEMSEEALRQSAERETWSLFRQGICHLKDGAPDHKPGSMPEALSRTSLRSSAFAAALGVRPPQFEQVLFAADFSNGHDAAFFFCRRLIDGAEEDIGRSRQVIHQRMLAEQPLDAFADIDALKRQMAFSFNVLTEVYGVSCAAFKRELGSFAS